MNTKFFILAFIVLAGMIGLMIMQASLLKRQPAPIAVAPEPTPNSPVTTTTPQPITPQPAPPAGPQVICYTSNKGISTSTWKTFSDPAWEITFQYPPDWKIDPDWPYPNFSNNGSHIYALIDNQRELIPMGAEEPSYCPRVIANQQVIIGKYLTAPLPTQIVNINGEHSYDIVATGASSTDGIFSVIVDTVRLVAK